MEPESSLLFGIASRLPSPPTRVAHHDEIGGRRDPLHNAIDLIGSNRGHATISNCYSKQRLEQPPNVGGRRYSAWKSPDFRNIFKSRSDISQLVGRLRSLRNFLLPEWRLPPKRSFFGSVIVVHKDPTQYPTCTFGHS